MITNLAHSSACSQGCLPFPSDKIQVFPGWVVFLFPLFVLESSELFFTSGSKIFVLKGLAISTTEVIENKKTKLFCGEKREAEIG